MSHASPVLADPCIYRVTHAACGWSILTFDWRLFADDHVADCAARRRDDLDYDFRVQCTTHNPNDDASQAAVVEE